VYFCQQSRKQRSQGIFTFRVYSLKKKQNNSVVYSTKTKKNNSNKFPNNTTGCHKITSPSSKRNPRKTKTKQLDSLLVLVQTGIFAVFMYYIELMVNLSLFLNALFSI
jgi:hypothetical protein